MADDVPLIIGPEGPQPTAPITLRTALVDNVSAVNPGFTADLPGSLIEDIVSTDTGALVMLDLTRVETLNDISPFGANQFYLNELGAIYGVPIGAASNTQVGLVFSGDAGFVLNPGFTVSDGTNQFYLPNGGVIATGGQSSTLIAIATQSGSFVVPAGTVTQIITSVPSTVTLSVTNPLAGTPGNPSGETLGSYRSRVLTAGLASAQGMPRFLRTVLSNVAGVQPRLIGIYQQPGKAWEVIVGGGDQYEIAWALYSSLFDFTTLTGSVMLVTGITNANPAVVTTSLNHGLSDGDVTIITGGLGMTQVNGTPYVVTVLSLTTFSIALDTSAFPSYAGGGIIGPNNRNVTVDLHDDPDTYQIVYVDPPQQIVAMTVLWNTSAPNFVGAAAVAQLAAPALIAYVNAVPVGQPMLVSLLNLAFLNAIAAVLPADQVTRLIFEVSINGQSVLPTTGTIAIPSDPESYFFITAAGVTVIQS